MYSTGLLYTWWYTRPSDFLLVCPISKSTSIRNQPVSTAERFAVRHDMTATIPWCTSVLMVAIGVVIVMFTIGYRTITLPWYGVKRKRLYLHIDIKIDFFLMSLIPISYLSEQGVNSSLKINPFWIARFNLDASLQLGVIGRVRLRTSRCMILK